MGDSIVFSKILDVLKEGSKSIQGIASSTGISSREVRDALIYYLKSPLKNCWRLEFYDDEIGKSRIALEVEDDIGILKSKLKPETSVSLWCNLDYVNNSMFLTGDERWALYDLLKECGSEFVEDVKNDILKEYHDEFDEKYRNISERRIIKGYRDIFDFNENLLFKIYDAVQKKCCIDVKLKDGTALKNILPVRVFLDDDLDRWHLEYLNQGYTENIWIKEILDVDVLPPTDYYHQDAAAGRNIRKPMTQVKIRVYDEKNARGRSVDFLSSKYITEEKVGYGYSDITARIMNIEAFKKWVMEMIPQVIIIEPLELRNEFSNMADEWVKNYMAGI